MANRTENDLETVVDKFEESGALKVLENEPLKKIGKWAEKTLKEPVEELGKSLETVGNKVCDAVSNLGKGTTSKPSEKQVKLAKSQLGAPSVLESVASRRDDPLYNVTSTINNAIQPEVQTKTSVFSPMDFRLKARGTNLGATVSCGDNKVTVSGNPIKGTYGASWQKGDYKVGVTRRPERDKTSIDAQAGDFSVSAFTQGSNNTYGGSVNYSSRLDLNSNVRGSVSFNNNEGVAASVSYNKSTYNNKISLGAFGSYNNDSGAMVGITGRVTF